MALSDVLKEARTLKNLKQEDVAQAINVTVQTYSKWENGKTEPKASQITPLAKLLGLTEKEICTGQKNVKLELIDFLGESSKYIKHVTEFDMARALWNVIDNDKEFLNKLEDIASGSTSYKIAQQSGGYTTNEDRAAEMKWQSDQSKQTI